MVSFAIIENDRVVNRIEADESYMIRLGKEYTQDSAAQIGAERVNGSRIAPNAADEPVQSEREKMISLLVELGVIPPEQAATNNG